MSQLDEKNRRQLVKRTYTVMALFTLGILLICILSAFLVRSAIQGERREPVAVFEGVEVSTLVELPGDRAYPEALTVGADGNIYSGSFCTGEIWRITPEGELTTWVKDGIDSASGMAFGADGYLYVIEHGDCDPRNSQISIKRIAPDGTVETFAAKDDDIILNGLAFDGAGNLYATDTQQGDVRIYQGEGQEQVWWELPESGEMPRPTGITYDFVNNAILIADSGNGKIYRVTITETGEPGQVDVLYENDERELDGIDLDEQGRLIITLYDLNQVARLNEDGTLEILAEDFREPSDVAYLDGRIYVTNFDSLSLAPLLSLLIDPSTPFSIDVIDLSGAE